MITLSSITKNVSSAGAGVAQAWKAAASFATAKAYPFMLRHKPPTRVLAAGLIAGMSYFISNIWKAEIDAEIRNYQAQRESISPFQSRFDALRESYATSRYQNEIVRLQRALLWELKGHDDPKMEEVFVTEESGAYRIVVLQDVLPLLRSADEFRGFLKSLPVGLSILHAKSPNPKSLGDILGSKAECSNYAIWATQHGNGTNRHRQQFIDMSRHFRQRVGQSFGSLKSEDINYELDQIASYLPFHVTAFGFAVADARFEKLPDAVASTEADRQTFEHEKAMAFGCVREMHERAVVVLSSAVEDAKTAVTELFVKPRVATKNWIERAEIALYVLSALVAFYNANQKPAPPSAPQNRLPRPDLSRKPKPIRRRHAL